MSMKRAVVLAVGGVVSLAAVGYARVSIQDEREFQALANRAAAMFGAPRAQSVQTTFTEVVVNNSAGVGVVGAFSDTTNGGGLFGVSNRSGGVRIVAGISSLDGGLMGLENSAGKVTQVWDANGGLISVAGDVAEVFPAAETLSPGSVVVIDPASHGAMRLASTAYDRRVAGVVAGANDYKPAITLRGMGNGEGRVPLTLTGTAYCMASNVNGPIKAGDMLTTSSVPGHAMKVTDFDAAHGAILGKALEDLKGDKGSILMLASLQ